MEAVSKFFGSLWEDLTKKVDLDTKRVRQATISSRAPDEELRRTLWDAMGAGGVLKPYAIGRFTGKMGKVYGLKNLPQSRADIFNMLKELLFVPQKEFSRIRGLYREISPRHLGSYTPGITGSGLDPSVALSRKAKPSTVWHEFVHARQYAPERIKGLEEMDLIRDLFKGLRSQKQLTTQVGVNPRDFYEAYNPLEAHARAVSGIMKQLPSYTKGKYFDSLYLAGLKDIVRELRKAQLDVRIAQWD